jgi:hypothetical protein
VTTTRQACSAITLALPGLQVLLDTLLQEQATATAGPGDAAGPLDRPALVAALQAMAQLLQAQDMEAMTAMSHVQQQFGAALGDDLAALETAMADMEFDKALPLVYALLEK